MTLITQLPTWLAAASITSCFSSMVCAQAPTTAAPFIVTAIEQDGKAVTTNDQFQSGKPLKDMTVSVADKLQSISITPPVNTAFTVQTPSGQGITVFSKSLLQNSVRHAAGEAYTVQTGRAQFQRNKPLGFFIVKAVGVEVFAGENAVFEVSHESATTAKVKVMSGRVTAVPLQVFSFLNNDKSFSTAVRTVLDSGGGEVTFSTPVKVEFASHNAAQAQLQSAFEAAVAAKDALQTANAQLTLAEFLLQVGKPVEAIVHLNAWTSSNRGNQQNMYEGNLKLGLAYEQSDDAASAAHYAGVAQRICRSTYAADCEKDKLVLSPLLARTNKKLNNLSGVARIEAFAKGNAAESKAGAVIVPPKLENLGVLKFPKRMFEWRLEGEVIFDVVYGADGVLRYPEVLKSSHPAFEIAIIKAIPLYKSTPSLIDGQPFSRQVRLPFNFAIDDGGRSSSSTGYKLDETKVAKAVETRAFDIAPIPQIVTLPAYPRALLLDETTGTATVAALVGANGLVSNVQVVEASHPDFGSSAKAMMHNWQFAPAIKDGRVISAPITYTHRFNFRERDNNINDETKRVGRELRSKSSDIVEMDALDARPKLLYQPQFNDPRPTRVADAKPDTVRLEFIIDREGQVQAPRIVSATNMDLAWSIATITGRWLYDVPKVKGQPAMVRHEMEFQVD